MRQGALIAPGELEIQCANGQVTQQDLKMQQTLLDVPDKTHAHVCRQQQWDMSKLV